MKINAIILTLALVMGFSFAQCAHHIDESGLYTLDDFEFGAGDCIEITADDVELDCDGDTMDGGGFGWAGIAIVDHPENIYIHDCIIVDYDGFGIWSTGVNNLTLRDNVFAENNDVGVYFPDAPTLANSLIEENEFYDNGFGLRSDFTVDTVIRNNYFEDHGGAIYLGFAVNTLIEENEINQNEVGIYLEDGAFNLTIQNNELYDAWANMWLMGMAFSQINGNEAYDAWQGIILQESFSVLIDPNLIHDHGSSGVKILNSSNITFLENEVYNNCWGPDGEFCAGVFIGNDSSNSLLEGNTVYNNPPWEPGESPFLIGGIWVGWAENITVLDNTIYDNMFGIVVFPWQMGPGSGFWNVSIENCNVRDNWYTGIAVIGMEGGATFTQIRNSRIHRNGIQDIPGGPPFRAGVYMESEFMPLIMDTEIYDNLFGVVLEDVGGGAFMRTEIRDNEEVGLIMDDSEVFFMDLELARNPFSLGLYDESELFGFGLAVYGTEVYLDEEMGVLVGDDFWFGVDSRHGVWYEGMEACCYYSVNEENLLIRSNFVSIDTDDGLGDFTNPTTVTTSVSGCGGLSHYMLEGFPESQDEILAEGETFSPEFESCSGMRATYSVPGLLTGYTAVGSGEDDKPPEYECESDSDCGECEYCSIANDACLPIEGCGEEELPPEPECTTNSDCAEGFVCENLECVEEEEPGPPEDGEGVEPECVVDEDCADGFVCENLECVKEPEPEPEPEPEGPTQEEAEEAVGSAQKAIDNAKADGKDTTEAEALLDEAEEALKNGNFEEAVELAKRAKLAAQAAAAPPPKEEVIPVGAEEIPPEEPPEPEEEFPWIPVIVVIIILGFLAWWFLFRGK